VVKIVVHPLQTPESFENKSATQLRDEIHNMISSALPYRQADDATAANKEA
jgi:1-acyl-sn-glycerol-3-phosphate acyltransferase